MSGAISPQPRRIGIIDGVVDSTSQLYFYQSGTSTPKDVYTSSTLGTPHSFPVTCDANGLFPEIWLGTGAYKEVFTNPSKGLATPEWTVDPVNITTPYAAGRAFNVRRTSTQTITTATQTTVQFSVEDLDTDAQFDAATDYRFETTLANGIWLFTASITVQSMTGNFTVEGISSQGGGTTLATITKALTAESYTIVLPFMNRAAFASGDTVTIKVTHTHGSDRTVTGSFFGHLVGLG